jgi:DHA1 family bicyclomycin/chloramphenicol resistance-like MFS transporter
VHDEFAERTMHMKVLVRDGQSFASADVFILATALPNLDNVSISDHIFRGQKYMRMQVPDLKIKSLPDIARQLNASTAQVQFTISAYLIGFAVGQIFYGPVSDRHGRKPVLMAAIALYCVASLACALSTSIEMLIVSRAVQALGGCGGIVLTRAIVRDIYSGARAGRELSMIAAVMALAPVLAPIAGGVLQTAFGWRSVFFTLLDRAAA